MRRVLAIYLLRTRCVMCIVLCEKKSRNSRRNQSIFLFFATAATLFGSSCDKGGRQKFNLTRANEFFFFLIKLNSLDECRRSCLKKMIVCSAKCYSMLWFALCVTSSRAIYVTRSMRLPVKGQIGARFVIRFANGFADGFHLQPFNDNDVYCTLSRERRLNDLPL